MNKIHGIKRLFVLAALALGAATAQASVPIYSDPSPMSQRCSPELISECENGTSTGNNIGANQGSRTVATTVSNQTSGGGEDSSSSTTSAGGANTARVTAGDFGPGWGVWTSYMRGDYENDFISQGTDLSSDTDLNSAMLGIDRLVFDDRLLLGVAFAYEDSDSQTGFNGGNLEGEGFGAVPYAGFIINDIFSADVSFGYTTLDYDQDRVSTVDGTPVTAGFDADRWFVSANLNATLVKDNWVFGGRIGILYTEEEQDAYTEGGSAATVTGGGTRAVSERNLDLTQFTIGGSIGYSFEKLEPFATFAYYNDTSRDDDVEAGGLPGQFTEFRSGDDDELQAGFGVNFFSDLGIYGSLQYIIIEGRDDFDGSTFMLNIRADLD